MPRKKLKPKFPEYVMTQDINRNGVIKLLRHILKLVTEDGFAGMICVASIDRKDYIETFTIPFMLTRNGFVVCAKELMESVLSSYTEVHGGIEDEELS